MANTMKLGINNSGPQYWHTQLTYKDLRKNGAFYITGATSLPTVHDTGGKFIPGDYKTDASGNPTDYIYSAVGESMPTGTYAKTLLCHNLSGSPPYPSGTYHVIYDGKGKIDLSFNGSGSVNNSESTNGGGSFTFANPNPTTHGIGIDLSSAAGETDYMRNIRVVHEDDVASYETQPFNQKMLDSLKELTDSDGGYLRAMDWGLCNADGGPNPRGGPPTEIQLAWRVAASSWDDRSKPYSPAGGGLGASLEHAVQICNTIDLNLWYCVPHRARPDFITSAATYIKNNLNSSLSTVVEWSNEFWNQGFYVNFYCWSGAADPSVSSQYYGGLTVTINGVTGIQAFPAESTVADWNGGASGGFSAADYRALYRYAADRTTETHDIFSSVFAATPQRPGLIRTIGAQSSNQYHFEKQLEWSGVNSNGPPSGSLDAVSIAPYFGGHLGRSPIANTIVSAAPGGNLQDGPWTYSSSVGDILASSTYDVSAPDGSVRLDVSGYKLLADDYNIDLYLYEAGHHLVGVGAYLNAMFDLFRECNEDPGMKTLYTIYLNMLQEEGVKISAMFALISSYSKHTMNGLQEYYNQVNRPKYDAILDWLYTQPTIFLNNVKYRLNINS